MARVLATGNRRFQAVNLTRFPGLSLMLFCMLAMAGGLCATAHAADPQIDVRLASSRINEEGSVILTVTLSGFSRNASDPVIPASNGFQAYQTGSSSNFSWVNGKMSSSKIYTFELVARKAGSYIVGPITVDDKGKSYRARPVELEVQAAATSPAGSNQGVRQTRSGNASGLSADDKDQGLFVRVEVDKSDPYVDQQITLRFKLYQRVDIRLTNIGEFTPPTTEGFWREDLGEQSEYDERIGDDRYRVREVAWALFPTKAGEITIGPGRVVCTVPTSRSNSRRGVFDFGFMNRENVPLRSQGLKVNVKPLPEAGRRASFTGTVGSYQMQSAFDVAEAIQGEPFTLNVTIAGAGHVQTIGAPAWPAWNGLRVFDSGESVDSRRNKDKVVGSKTFTQVLVPNQAGEISLDPIEFQFFDPRRGSYQTLSSSPLSIRVAPATSFTGGLGREDVVALGDDILYIRQNIVDGIASRGDGNLSWQWLLHLIPLILLAVGFQLRRRRLALERNPVLARRARALRQANLALESIAADTAPDALAAQLASILEAYLSAWLDQEVRGIRRQDLSGELSEIGIAGAVIEKVLALLGWADEVRFGGAVVQQQQMELNNSRQLITELEEAMRGSNLRSLNVTAPMGRSTLRNDKHER
jgi:BatD DUF11 like domain